MRWWAYVCQSIILKCASSLGCILLAQCVLECMWGCELNAGSRAWFCTRLNSGVYVGLRTAYVCSSWGSNALEGLKMGVPGILACIMRLKASECTSLSMRGLCGLCGWGSGISACLALPCRCAAYLYASWAWVPLYMDVWHTRVLCYGIMYSICTYILVWIDQWLLLFEGAFSMHIATYVQMQVCIGAFACMCLKTRWWHSARKRCWHTYCIVVFWCIFTYSNLCAHVLGMRNVILCGCECTYLCFCVLLPC